MKRTGKRITTVPEKPENKFGRPLFQNLLYSDTPTQPLAKMEFTIPKGAPLSGYQISAVNTVGLESQRGCRPDRRPTSWVFTSGIQDQD